MKNIGPHFFFFPIIILLLVSCKNEDDKTEPGSDFKRPVCSATVTDVDGNVYCTVVIGSQTWMQENLKTSHYRNDSLIPTGLDNNVWATTKQGACATYDNDIKNEVFGKLYNFYAVTDPRGLCPTGWHVPTDSDWKTLEVDLGMPAEEINLNSVIRGATTNVGGKMKAITNLWTSPNAGATDSSGFLGLPVGYRYGNGGYGDSGEYGYFWSSSDSTSDSGFSRYLYYNAGYSSRYVVFKSFGFNVRCVMD